MPWPRRALGGAVVVGLLTCACGRSGLDGATGEATVLPTAEVCDGQDNDGDGLVDEGFVDKDGVYRVDERHCGQCDVDCVALTTTRGAPFRCGGELAVPTCMLACPREGSEAAVGDAIDADGDPATGCECVLAANDDEPGAAKNGSLDDNCDGADGVVMRSLYVAPDGDDLADGAPGTPLRTIGKAVARAAASLDTSVPRPDVFVAAGVYLEAIELADGVRLHGGYRRDFRALDVDQRRVEVRAPAGGATLASVAALVARGVGTRSTVVEGMTLVGADAGAAGVPAIGALVSDPGAKLVLRHLVVQSGVGAPGASGANGEMGSQPATAAMAGDVARLAVEDDKHACKSTVPNLVQGGAGGKNVCDGVSVNGGDGGTSRCPFPIAQQVSGITGASTALAQGGIGGPGGNSREGPVLDVAPGCQDGVCCGAYYAPVPLHHAGDGARGADGPPVADGQSCDDALGSFVGEVWAPGVAMSGTSGQPGAGGGGGGAGGGVQMAWSPEIAALCGFPDAIGGGGGGGGAGGCGGKPGQPGASGAPSIALLMRLSQAPATWPVIEDVRLMPGQGGQGGQGGRGGQGAVGGVGAVGTALAPEVATSVPYSGTEAGGRGGDGGNGSQGGGGGGGCGGASVGLWLSGVPGLTAPAAYLASNPFVPGNPGASGHAGSGAASGAQGGAVDVVVR